MDPPRSLWLSATSAQSLHQEQATRVGLEVSGLWFGVSVYESGPILLAITIYMLEGTNTLTKPYREPWLIYLGYVSRFRKSWDEKQQGPGVCNKGDRA